MKDTVTFKIHFSADLKFTELPPEIAEKFREMILKLKTKKFKKKDLRVDVEEIK